VVAVLFVGVAAGQVLLFGGRKPREASISVGVVLFPLEWLAVLVYQSQFAPRRWDMGCGEPVLGLLCMIPSGAVFGYLAGTLTAGIFLVMQRFRDDREAPGQVSVELRPFAASDIDTLIRWTGSWGVFGLWARAEFTYPLDRPQLESYLQRAAGENPDLFVFKAVDRESGRTVGHVELDRIDRALRSARMQHVLVGPAEPSRHRLGMALIHATLRTAFDQMGLHRVEVLVLEWDWDAIACYKRAGFAREGVLRDALRLAGDYRRVNIMSILDWEWRLRQRRPGRAREKRDPETRPT
jgi:RimJ/RimL family protein N-acetyltransferase